MDASASSDTTVADGSDVTDKDAASPSPEESASSPVGGQAPQASADCTLPEKDMAREAWRRNWPTVCALSDTAKAFVLVPIKGALNGETHALVRRPNREARINLPAGAEPQLTLKQYKLNHLGFKDVRIAPAKDGNRARVRVKLLPEAGDPVFEVKEGYVKITVAVPSTN